MEASKVQAAVAIIITAGVMAAGLAMVIIPLAQGRPTGDIVELLKTYGSVWLGPVGAVMGYIYGKRLQPTRGDDSGRVAEQVDASL